MDYEIIDIQTVTLFLEENSPGEEITTVEVSYAWDDNLTSGRIEIKGRPTNDEILAEIKKRGEGLLKNTQEPVGKGLLKKGSL